MPFVRLIPVVPLIVYGHSCVNIMMVMKLHIMLRPLYFREIEVKKVQAEEEGFKNQKEEEAATVDQQVSAKQQVSTLQYSCITNLPAFTHARS